MSDRPKASDMQKEYDRMKIDLKNKNQSQKGLFLGSDEEFIKFINDAFQDKGDEK